MYTRRPRSRGVVDTPITMRSLVIVADVGEHFDGFFRGAALNCKSTNIHMPAHSPDCLLGVVPQPTDSRLSETTTASVYEAEGLRHVVSTCDADGDSVNAVQNTCPLSCKIVLQNPPLQEWSFATLSNV